MITRIKLHNFKRFKEFSVELNDSLNLLIGDNESGKSTILSAIDIVLSGSRSKVENLGLDSLFNSEVIEDFLRTEKKYSDLPGMFIELYLVDQENKDLEGKYNSDDIVAHGLLLLCEPRQDLSKEIKEILEQPDDNFPFEYYSISFRTFSGDGYTGYRKCFQHLFLDNTQINNEYATKTYIKTLYESNVDESEKTKHQNEYRKHKERFQADVLKDLNDKINEYSFAVRTNSKANLQTDLTIKEGNIALENRGKGRQCFIKADFALQKSKRELDVVLIEEPENHLSHVNMKKLIRRIDESEDKQLFVATHSSLISTRLDLRKAILLASHSTISISLKDLKKETANFFIKAPDNNLLEYVLSNKVVLVEGDSEFLLMEKFFERITGEKPEDSGIHVIAVGGTSFKRYLDVAKLIDIKTAVVRDNDGNYEENCEKRYEEYINERTQIFCDRDNAVSTFEMAIFQNNEKICTDLFGEARRTLSVLDFMLANKTEAAFELLTKKGDELEVPEYLNDAIEWIRS